MKELEDCYENMIQPQKRLLIKDMLDCVLVRILELRKELIQFNIQTKYLNK
jgi:hypothetical protein